MIHFDLNIFRWCEVGVFLLYAPPLSPYCRCSKLELSTLCWIKVWEELSLLVHLRVKTLGLSALYALLVGNFYNVLSLLEILPVSRLLRVFPSHSMNVGWDLSNALYVNWYGHMIFSFLSCWYGRCNDWILDVEFTFHTGNKSHLIIVCNSFYILFDSNGSYLVDAFYM